MRSAIVRRAVPAVLALCAAAANAQTAPGKSLTLIVPYPSGSISHRVAQQIAAGLGTIAGWKVSLESEGTAAEPRRAIERLLRADPAKPMILFADVRLVSLASTVDPSFGFDPSSDLAPVALIATVALDVAAGSGSAAVAALDVAPAAAARPWRIVAGTPVSNSYACALLLKQHRFPEASIRSVRGSAPALEELASGRADLFCDTRALLATSVANATVTTRPAASLAPGAGADVGWYAVFAPRATDRAVLDELAEAFKSLRSDLGYRESLKGLAAEPVAAGRMDAGVLREVMTHDRALLLPLFARNPGP